MRAWTIDAGGEVSSGGTFRIYGVMGQHDAAVSAAGPYRLTGGLAPHAVERTLYLPVVEK